MYNTRYYTWRKNLEKYNDISSKMYKQLVQQIVHQKVQQKCSKNWNKKCTIIMLHFW